MDTMENQGKSKLNDHLRERTIQMAKDVKSEI
jgi:hypothetical protein